MKASAHFVKTLHTGIELLRTKYGADTVAGLPIWIVYNAVHDSVCDGHQHNAKVTMNLDPAFQAESRELRDAHIETAVKAALAL